MLHKPKYRVSWGQGFSQLVYSKKEAFGIVADLLNTYDNVTITRL